MYAIRHGLLTSPSQVRARPP